MIRAIVPSLALAATLAVALAVAFATPVLAEEAPPVEGTTWQILAVGPALPPDAAATEMIFDAERGSGPSMAATVGCNRFAGGYTLEGTALSFSEAIISTQMACPDALFEAETALSEVFAATTHLRQTGDILALYGEGDALLAVLRAVP